VAKLTDSWACFLQRFSTPWLDTLVYWITNLGSETFFILVLPAMYWLWNRRSGSRIALVYLGSVYVNSVLKAAFHTPRPVPADCARVMHPETGGGYSFPSGHAQGSTVYWGQTAVEIRRKAMWAAAVVAIVLISLSRIYLNVHWPVDVAGGIFIGIVIIRAYNILAVGWENLRPPVWLRAACIIAFPTLGAILYRDPTTNMVLGFLIGFPLGNLMAEGRVRWVERASLAKQIVKFCLGMAGLLVVRYGLKAVFPEAALWDVVRYAVAGMWVSLGAPYLFVRFGLQG
jgi:membrane-associated phospholipid phosphatase